MIGNSKLSIGYGKILRRKKHVKTSKVDVGFKRMIDFLSGQTIDFVRLTEIRPPLFYLLALKHAIYV